MSSGVRALPEPKCEWPWYHLNYFTVRELCSLVESLPQIGSDPLARNRVWALLRCVDVQADEVKLMKEVAVKWAER